MPRPTSRLGRRRLDGAHGLGGKGGLDSTVAESLAVAAVPLLVAMVAGAAEEFCLHMLPVLASDRNWGMRRPCRLQRTSPASSDEHHLRQYKKQ
jgi:hypothetical protein